MGRPLEAPLLETPRTIMRPHRVEDFDALADMWADPEVVRYISGKPSTRPDSWARLLRYLGHWHALPYGFWAVEEKTTERYLGDIGFADFKRDIHPSLDGIPEIGWVFRTAAHGRGLASETIAALTGWGEANLESERTFCIIAPGHAASIRVARKNGYREFDRTVYMGQPALLLDRKRGTA